MVNRRKLLGDYCSSRNILLFLAPLFVLSLISNRTTAAQAALSVFMLFAIGWLWLLSRRLLDGVAVQRTHAPRVFMLERLDLTLTLTNTGRMSPQFVLVEDQFMAGIEVLERHLVTELRRGWEVELHVPRVAERHRGLYLLGPVKLFAADPLGVFTRQRTLEHFTRLTVYPTCTALPNYTIPAPQSASGMSMDAQARVGLGDEILGLREYVPGDSPSRIHWRTSARRGEWHVTQRNRTLHAELLVLLDLTRLSRYGLGQESTTESGIEAATAVLTRAQQTQHSFALSLSREVTTHYPAGSGLAHFHLLVDRLAIVEPQGEADYWGDSAERALRLAPGSRAVFIVATNRTDVLRALPLFNQLISEDIRVDLILLDDTEYIRIYQEHEQGLRRAGTSEKMAELLRETGARVTILPKAAPRLGRDFS